MSQVMIILAEGFEEIEAITVIDILRRANISVCVTGLTSKSVKGSHDIHIFADSILDDEMDRLDQYSMVVLPGGLPGAYNLRDSEQVIRVLQYMNQKNKYLGAICAAPIVLAKAGVLDNKKATSYPGHLEKLDLQTTKLETISVVIDGNVVTSRGPATAMDFSLVLVELLTNRDQRMQLAKKLLL